MAEMTTVAVPTETRAGERRVALVPGAVASLRAAGLRVVVQAGAGKAAGFSDEEYVDRGAEICPTRADIFAAEVILQVRTYGANPEAGASDLRLFRRGQVVIGFCDALWAPEAAGHLAASGVTAFAMDLIPRIARAQAMDALSSQATVAGYKAVLIAANRLPKMFPMLTTAAGTLPPARVFVVGAGVAGLQAIATARRLGAAVEAYDVRPAAQEDVESLGAKLVQLPLSPGDAQDPSGYAKALGEEFYRRQQELLTGIVAVCDAVITTATISGRQSPRLITSAAVAGMAPGSVVVDLAAERGGNCELTRPDEEIVHHGVTIFGPTNLPAAVPHEASQMYARNAVAFLRHLMHDGRIAAEHDDEIVRSTLLACDGRVVNPRILAALGEEPG